MKNRNLLTVALLITTCISNCCYSEGNFRQTLLPILTPTRIDSFSMVGTLPNGADGMDYQITAVGEKDAFEQLVKVLEQHNYTEVAIEGAKGIPTAISLRFRIEGERDNLFLFLGAKYIVLRTDVGQKAFLVDEGADLLRQLSNSVFLEKKAINWKRIKTIPIG